MDTGTLPTPVVDSPAANVVLAHGNSKSRGRPSMARSLVDATWHHQNLGDGKYALLCFGWAGSGGWA